MPYNQSIANKYHRDLSLRGIKENEVTFLLVTYNRPREVREVLGDIGRHCGTRRFHLHIADDGSPSGYIDSIVSEYGGGYKSVKSTVTRRKGWGANVNKAIKHIKTEFIFMIEDDYVPISTLDIHKGIVLMKNNLDIGIVRYDGVSGHNGIELVCDTVKVDHNPFPDYVSQDKIQFLHVQKKALHKDVRLNDIQMRLYTYSNRPKLMRLTWFDDYGLYSEGKKLGDTEASYAARVKKINGLSIATLPDYVVSPFRHIGKSRQHTALDTGGR